MAATKRGGWRAVPVLFGNAEKKPKTPPKAKEPRTRRCCSGIYCSLCLVLTLTTYLTTHLVAYLTGGHEVAMLSQSTAGMQPIRDRSTRESLDHLLFNHAKPVLRIYVYTEDDMAAWNGASADSNAVPDRSAVPSLTQEKVYHYMLDCPCRTWYADEADFFFVPPSFLGYVAALSGSGGDSGIDSNGATRDYDWSATLGGVLKHLDLANGEDHVFAVNDTALPESFKGVRRLLPSAIFLSPQGDYAGGGALPTPPSIPFFNPFRDILVPTAVQDSEESNLAWYSKPVLKRANLAYVHEALYTTPLLPGGESIAFSQMLDRQQLPVIVGGQPSGKQYQKDIANSKFCIIPKGVQGKGVIARLTDAVLAGCIPVVVGDTTRLPYQAGLNYLELVVKWPEASLKSLMPYLGAADDRDLLALQQQLKQVRCLFSWSRASVSGCNAFAAMLHDLQKRASAFKQSREMFWPLRTVTTMKMSEFDFAGGRPKPAFTVHLPESRGAGLGFGGGSEDLEAVSGVPPRRNGPWGAQVSQPAQSEGVRAPGGLSAQQPGQTWPSGGSGDQTWGRQEGVQPGDPAWGQQGGAAVDSWRVPGEGGVAPRTESWVEPGRSAQTGFMPQSTGVPSAAGNPQGAAAQPWGADPGPVVPQVESSWPADTGLDVEEAMPSQTADPSSQAVGQEWQTQAGGEEGTQGSTVDVAGEALEDGGAQEELLPDAGLSDDDAAVSAEEGGAEEIIPQAVADAEVNEAVSQGDGDASHFDDGVGIDSGEMLDVASDAGGDDPAGEVAMEPDGAAQGGSASAQDEDAEAGEGDAAEEGTTSAAAADDAPQRRL